jgi:hypothetical protein
MATTVQPLYDKLKTAIDNIDEQLDAADDSGAATKRRVINELVEAQKETWSASADGLIRQLSALEDDDEFVGVVEGILSAIRSASKERIEKHVSAKVEAAPKVTSTLSDEQIAELSKNRSALYQQIKMAVELAAYEGVTLEMPKTRRGSKGKRGVRAMSLMRWAVNGEELPADTMYKDLAKMLGFESGKDLTAALKEKGVNTTKPEHGKISVSFEDGKTLEGHIPDYVEEEEAEEEVDETDDGTPDED